MSKTTEYISKWTNRLLCLLFYLCITAVLLVTLQVFCVTSFKIPTDSMEPELLSGDNILVNKLTKGARLFNVLASLRGEDIAIYRMLGMGELKRNDVLVFNFPYQPQRWDSIAFDVMKYYVKRCIAIPGDTLEIRNSRYRIKGSEEELGNVMAQNLLASTPDTLLHNVEMNAFPWNERLGWTIREFGPLPVPAKGQVVKMDSTTWLFYRQLISWEQKSKLTMDANGSVLLGDSVIQDYRFQENYYFMAGDKMLNSQDSRYWGLLPESFIVGKVWRIWKSVDPVTGKMRWNRFLKKVH